MLMESIIFAKITLWLLAHLSIAVEHRLLAALLAAARTEALFRAFMKHSHKVFLLF